MDILVGRIETLAFDAVVNAANRRLLPGTGVDGALRVAAGPALTRLTSTLPPLDVGAAIITPGFDAPARHIIHTAAPVWTAPGDDQEKIVALAQCYASCVALAEQHALQSIAFPCLGTGNFGWPRDLACETAIAACTQALAEISQVERLVFCCFSELDAAPYRMRLRRA